MRRNSQATVTLVAALCSTPLLAASGSETASELTVRVYEVLGALSFVAGGVFVWRRRSPLYLGIYLGASIGAAVFEWIYDTKFYFRLTASDYFIPAWTADGVKAPLAMILFYAFMWGIPFMLLLENHERLVSKLGNIRRFYFLLAVFAAISTPIFEITNVSVTHIYTYHQQEQYLLWGMPWSQFWFAPLLIVCSYWSMLKARTLASGQDVTTQFALGFAAVIMGFFVASALNGVWYMLAEPWTDTPRSF